MIVIEEEDVRLLVDRIMHKTFAWDFETSGLSVETDRPLGLALAWLNDNGVVSSAYVAFEHTVCTHGTTDGVTNVYIPLTVASNLFRPLFEQRDVVAIAHNMKFDIKWLWKMGIDVRCSLYDTMLGAWMLNENAPSFGLKQQTLAVFGHQMERYKDLAVFTNYGPEEFLAVPLDAAATYAAEDTVWTYRHYEHQVPRLKAERVYDAFMDYGMKLLPVLAEMELAGMRVDRAAVAALKADYEAKATEYGRRVWDAGMDMIDAWIDEGREVPPGFLMTEAQLAKHGETITELDSEEPVLNGRRVVKLQPSPRHKPRLPFFNVASNKHMGTLLYDHYGIKAPIEFNIPKKDDGTYGVDKNVLTLMKYTLGDTAPVVLDDLLTWRKYEKAVGTYLDPFLARSSEDGVIHGSFNQHITRTGRLSSNQPNLQNIPSRGAIGKDIRKLFIPHDGELLIVADFSMLELRLLAHFSNDAVMKHAFENELDLHTVTGARQAGLSYDVLKARVDAGDVEAKQLRMIGKTANFALAYGMGPKKYQIYLLVNNETYFPLPEVERQIHGFNQAYPDRYRWAEWVKGQAKLHGFVRTLSGRKRRLPELYSRDRWEVGGAERQAVNVLAQGGGADILMYVMPIIQDRLRPLGGRIIAQIHDEVVCSVKEEHAEEARTIVEETMSVLPTDHFRLRTALKAEAKIGGSWYECK